MGSKITPEEQPKGSTKARSEFDEQFLREFDHELRRAASKPPKARSEGPTSAPVTLEELTLAASRLPHRLSEIRSYRLIIPKRPRLLAPVISADEPRAEPIHYTAMEFEVLPYYGPHGGNRLGWFYGALMVREIWPD